MFVYFFSHTTLSTTYANVFFFRNNSVREQSSENLMTTKNLAVVFAPTLMRDHDATRDLLDMSYKNATLEYLINQAMQLFP